MSDHAASTETKPTRTPTQAELDALIAANDRLEDALTESNAACARHYDRVKELERKLELAQAAQRMLSRAFD
jgi:hypothetical protein